MTIVAQIKQALQDMGFRAQPEIETVRAELASAQADVKKAGDTVAELTAAVESQAKVIDGLRLELKAALEQVGAKAAELITIKAELEAEKNRTNEVLSGMGVTVKQIPGATPTSAPTGSKSILDQLEEISDPTERAKFRIKYRSELFAALKQQQSK